MWRHVKEKRNLIEFDLRNVSTKNHKETKRLVLHLEALYLLKTYFTFSLVQYQNSDQEKKSFLKFSFFEGTPRPENFVFIVSPVLQCRIWIQLILQQWTVLIFKIRRISNYWVLFNAFSIFLRLVRYRFVIYRFAGYTFRFFRYRYPQ